MIVILFLIGFNTIHIFWYKSIYFFGKSYQLPGLPFSLDILPLTMAFFSSGFLMKEQVKRFRPKISLIFLAGIVFFLVAFYSDAYINLNKRIYIEPLKATLAAFSGIYIILTLSYAIEKGVWISKLLRYFGSSSLFILIFHAFIGSTVYNFLTLNFGNEYPIFFAWLSFILAISLPIGIKNIVKRTFILRYFYFPSNNLKIK